MTISKGQLEAENKTLRRQIQEISATLAAIRNGEADALVLDGPDGERIFSLNGVDHTYRLLIEEMRAGAITLNETGTVLYANRYLQTLLDIPLEKFLGSSFEPYVAPPDLPAYHFLLKQRRDNHFSTEIKLKRADDTRVPVLLSANRMIMADTAVVCVAVTDLSERKQHEKILDQERLSRSIIEQSADAIVVCTDQGIVMRASKVAHALAGHSCLNEAFDEAFQIKLSPERSEASNPAASAVPFKIAQVINGERFYSRQAVIAKKEHGTKYLLLNAAPLTDDNARIIGAIVNLTDISEKIELEHQLKESRNWLTTTLKSIGDGVIATDKAGRVVLMNPVAEKLTGWTEVEATGRPMQTVFKIINELTRKEMENPVNLVLRKGVVVDLANHSLLISKSGRKIPIADSGAPITVNHQIIGAVLVFRDQTKERAALKALQESEARYRGAVEDSPVLICSFLPNGEITFVNSAYCNYFSKSAKALIGSKFIDLIPAAVRKFVQANIAALTRKAPTRSHEHRVFDRDGAIRWQRWTNRAMFDANGKIVAYQSIGEDVTKRKQAEEDLRKSEQKYQDLFENAPDMYISFDVRSTKVINCNRTTVALLGYAKTEIIANALTDFFPPASTSCFETQLLPAFLSTGLVESDELQLITKDGRTIDVNLKASAVYNKKGNIIQSRSIWRDISIQKKLENQLIQAQKMESVGRLAGGIAHDFNNMLSIINGYSALALEKLNPVDPLSDDITEIQKAGQRSADLTRQLLAFARQQIVSPKVVDLNCLIRQNDKMLCRLIGEDISINTIAAQDLWLIKIDPSQIDQLLVNLAVNSRDAISGVGRITIETSNVSLDNTFGMVHPGFMPGQFILLTFSDSGCGMAPEIQSKIFEPFFTTKAEGKGTGLGLATIYGIVKQNNGFIDVYSEPGQGSTFKVYLPRHQGERMPDRDTEASAPMTGSETILVVEDEAQILRLCQRALESNGYQVLTADKPGEAIILCEKNVAKIDLLLTDVVMPTMNGKELMQRIKALKPDVRVLFMSGYTANVIAHRGVLGQGVNFIQKPFSPKDLLARVRALMDQK